MRMFLAIALMAVVAGCDADTPDENAAAPEATMTEAAATTAATPASTGAAPVPGSYTVVDADGTESPFTMAADGTWTGTNAKGDAVKGTYKQDGGKTCFTTDPASPDDTCWTSQPAAADGSFTSTSDKGRTVTVRVAA